MPCADRRVLGRQPEGVEAHREEHVVTAHALEARERVGRRQRVPVADVQRARRIRVHRQRDTTSPPVQCRRRDRAGPAPSAHATSVRSSRVVDLDPIRLARFSLRGAFQNVGVRSHCNHSVSTARDSNIRTKKKAFRPCRDERRPSFRGTTLVDQTPGVLVELRGLEPLTSTLPVLRSPG